MIKDKHKDAEANRLKRLAIDLGILEESFIAPESKYMTRFKPEFQEKLYAHQQKMVREGNTRFDEAQMGIVITDYRYEIGGYAEIDKIKGMVKKDPRSFYEMCGMLNLFMVKVHRQGLDYE